MKIAFVGKGGSGKTTLAGLFLRHLHSDGAPVLAIDADINQHLAGALGEHLPLIKEYLRGDNPLITSADEMIKTTPAGRGSRLLDLGTRTPIHDQCVRAVGGIPLAVTGPFAQDDLGVACYHSKVGAAE